MPGPDGEDDEIIGTQETNEAIELEPEEEQEDAAGEDEPESAEDEDSGGDDGDDDASAEEEDDEQERPLTESSIRAIIAEAMGSVRRSTIDSHRSIGAPDTSAFDADIAEAKTRYQRIQQRIQKVEEDGRDPTSLEALLITEEREINRLQKEKTKKLNEYQSLQSQEQAFNNRDTAVNALYQYQPQVPANLRVVAEKMAEEFLRGRGSDWQRIVALVDDPTSERIVKEIRAFGERRGMLSPSLRAGAKVAAKPVGARKVTMKGSPIKTGGGVGGAKGGARKPVRHTEEERKILGMAAGIGPEEIQAYEAKGRKHPLLKEIET